MIIILKKDYGYLIASDICEDLLNSKGEIIQGKEPIFIKDGSKNIVVALNGNEVLVDAIKSVENFIIPDDRIEYFKTFKNNLNLVTSKIKKDQKIQGDFALFKGDLAIASAYDLEGSVLIDNYGTYIIGDNKSHIELALTVYGNKLIPLEKALNAFRYARNKGDTIGEKVLVFETFKDEIKSHLYNEEEIISLIGEKDRYLI